MDMPEGVHIEIHLVVCAEPVIVYSKHRELREYVIYGGGSDLGLAFGKYMLCHHISGRMSESHHGFVYGYSLRSRLQGMIFEDNLEFLNVRASVCIHEMFFKSAKVCNKCEYAK